MSVPSKGAHCTLFKIITGHFSTRYKVLFRGTAGRGDKIYGS